MREHIGICLACREESQEYNPTPAEIAEMCQKMRASNMQERNDMLSGSIQDSSYAPRIYRISRFHKN